MAKLVRVPFDVEMAREIMDGDVEGKIVTRNGKVARIIYWKLCNANHSIIYLIKNDDGNEDVKTCTNEGKVYIDCNSSNDLLLEIPEYLCFKEGSIITLGWAIGSEYCEWISIIRNIESFKGEITTDDYVSLCLKADPSNIFGLEFDTDSDAAKWVRESTGEEKQKLIDALKESKDPRARQDLKLFFNIDIEPECKLKPFDKVLVRKSDSCVWGIDFFCKYTGGFEPYQCMTGSWKLCIPFNEKTQHLVGTTKTMEG